VTKYISEVVTAVVEATIRLKDVPAMVALCSAMHQR
jgi:hypothetical protein